MSKKSKKAKKADKSTGSEDALARVGVAEGDAAPAAKPKMKKKAYEKPAIVHSEKIEARANACSKSDDSCANTGPLTS